MRWIGTNARTRHAIQVVVYLARRDNGRVTPVSEIAAAVHVSPKSLEEILGALRTAGIVRSRRGKEGGYQLVLEPRDLSMLQIVQAVDGPLERSPESSEDTLRWAVEQAFDRAADAAAAELSQVTVEALVETARRRKAEPEAGYMYYV